MPLPLHRHRRSLDLESLLDALRDEPNLLIIQDLDGVCMGLVRDPRRRQIDPAYLHACARMAGHFYVLTNGEHVGPCGVNGLVEAALSDRSPEAIRSDGLYLPGLGAGGVQLQDARGNLSHPGVSEAEMSFLAAVPEVMREALRRELARPPFELASERLEEVLGVIVLDNRVSPTINIGSLFDAFGPERERFRRLQDVALRSMRELRDRAEAQGLGESFFIHLAPNLGVADGEEISKPAAATDMGTTDFQFMLRGAIKHVGVALLLNHYYFQKTGRHPLGRDFNARSAPRGLDELLELAGRAFDPAIMPRILAVGDTVTSSTPSASSSAQGGLEVRRGGSDRGFLHLVQALGRRFERDNAVVLVDSSRGELERPGVTPLPAAGDAEVPLSALAGITDADDPLAINFVVPHGHPQYVEFFRRLAEASSGASSKCI